MINGDKLPLIYNVHRLKIPIPAYNCYSTSAEHIGHIAVLVVNYGISNTIVLEIP